MSCLLLALLLNVLEAKAADKGNAKKGVNPKQRTLKRRTDLQLGEKADVFHKYCTEIFGQKFMYAHVIKAMTMGIMNKLEDLCADTPIHPLTHKKFSESLVCGDSLEIALGKMLDILYNQVPKPCREKRGFVGFYVFKSMLNEEDNSKE